MTKREQESTFKGKYQSSVYDTIYQAYRPALFRTIIFLIVGFLGRIALLGNANLIGYWADSLCIEAGSNIACKLPPIFLQSLESKNFVWFLGIATALGFLLTLIYRIGLSRTSAESISLIYDETTLRTSRLPISFFDRNPSGRVMTRFSSDYNNVFRIFGGPLAEFITLVFDLIAMTFLITLASPWLLPFWLLQGILNFGVYRYYLPSLRKERREMARSRSPGIAHFAESANGRTTIRAFGKQNAFLQRFSELNDFYLHRKKHATGVFIRFSFATNVVTAFVLLSIGLASIWLAKNGKISVGSIGVSFVYLGLSAGILQSFFEWLGQFEEAMSGLERMNEYLRKDIEPGAKLPITARFRTNHPVADANSTASSPIKPRPSGNLGASVEICDLVLRYREDLPPVLSGVTLHIEAGERIAIIGKTGSGKTSLVQALFRIYPIESGTIRIGGHEAIVSDHVSVGDLVSDRFIDLVRYRSLLSYITQEPTLFIGTVRQNLDSVERRPERDLIQALKQVQFLSPEENEEAYRKLMKAPVEERGRNFSSGERQLLCLARCLLEDSPVVILDEATSAVDPKSEEILIHATDAFFQGKTQIIIAHRLSTIRTCDRVLWLQNGKIHQIGKPETVLAQFEKSELLT